MAKKIQETKAAKLQKAMRTSKKEKKKWTGGPEKVVDKKRIAFMEKELFEKISKDTESMKFITKSMISDRYNIDLFLATRVLRELTEMNKIQLLKESGKFVAYGGGKFSN